MLVGREPERARFEELLDAVESGPVGCVLEGMPGIGKTTAWREFVECAHGRGYHVLEAAPSEPDASLAFSALGDLFERIPEDVFAGLPEVQAQALKAALLLSEPPEGSRDLQAIPRAILHVLRQLAGPAPLVVAIDNEQWLDPASARVLGFALGRLREERVMVIMARRSEEAGALSSELDKGSGGLRVEPISLPPLPIGVIKRLLEDRLGRPIPAPVLRRIHGAAAGNPLWALAIALELESDSGGERSADLTIPRTLSDAIELRLAHIDPRAGAAMLAVAALSQPTLALLQAAIPEFALSDLESAEQAGVIEVVDGRVRFTHPLLASTHYANTPVSQRREFHRLLATVIDDEVERAQHLALGAEAPDAGLADKLERAADVAARRGAHEAAAQLLEDAARLTPIDDGHARSSRIVASAEHRFTIGEVTRARYMLTELMPALPAGSLRARARLQLAVISADEPGAATKLLESALADADEDDRLRIQIEWELTFAASAVGQLPAARQYAQSALRTAERLKDPELVTRALAEVLFTFVTTGEPLREDVLARLTEITEAPGTTTYYQPATEVALARHFAGDLEGARPVLEQAAQQALSRGEEWDRMVLERNLAELEWEMGDRSLAERHRAVAHEALGEFAEGLVHHVALDARFALGYGDLATARAKAEQGLALAERAGAVLHTNRFIALLAWADLLSGEAESAHDRLKEQREWLQSIGFGPAGYSKAYIWSLDAEALIALGRLEEAAEVLTELASRAEACKSDNLRAITSRLEGLLLARHGDLFAAIEAMDAALEAHLRSPRVFEHGLTLLEKGSIQRRAKRKALAKRTLEEALEILEPLNATIWAERARDELSRIGLRRAAAADGLTPAQTRVAELAAAGATNPEIARELHMSVRTVQSHLSRVFQEHGVSSRGQLIAALAKSGEADAAPDAASTTAAPR